MVCVCAPQSPYVFRHRDTSHVNNTHAHSYMLTHTFTHPHTHTHTRIFLADVILEVFDSCYLALIQIKLCLRLTLSPVHLTLFPLLSFSISSLSPFTLSSLSHACFLLSFHPTAGSSFTSFRANSRYFKNRVMPCAPCAHTHVLLW